MKRLLLVEREREKERETVIRIPFLDVARIPRIISNPERIGNRIER